MFDQGEHFAENAGDFPVNNYKVMKYFGEKRSCYI
jgi:hypothetical protein